MKRVLIGVVVAWLAGGTAWASNIYSVSYEGNDMPESEAGWRRTYDAGGAIRTIEQDPDDPHNHFLLINSLANHAIYDYAYYPRRIDPNGPSERFVSEWRVLILESYGSADQGVTIESDAGNSVGLHYTYDRLEIYDGAPAWISIAPGVFHTYRLESDDMVDSTLWIDGAVAHQAPLFEGLLHSYVTFGDGTQYGGARSRAEWDYFRFGVTIVPEPASISVFLGMCVCVGRRRS